jgi:limonene-1,2-epoxide hydrolase
VPWRSRLPGVLAWVAMTEPLETIGAFVDAFVAAWPTGEAGSLGDFFTEDAVYHNGPLAPVAGRAAIVQTLEALMAIGGRVSVDMVHVVANGNVVMTERVDVLEANDRSVTLPVLGVFELAGGRIAAWRDYFDLDQFSAQQAEPASPSSPNPGP